MGFENNVVIQLTAQEEDMVNAWRKVRREGPQALEKELRKVQQASTQASTSLSQFMKAQASDVGRFALSVAGVGSAVAAISTIAGQLRREYDELIRRRQAAADVQKSVSGAQLQSGIALGIDSTLNDAQVEKRIVALSARTGLDPAALFMRAAGAFSARGSLSGEQALKTVEMVAEKMKPLDEESGNYVTQAILDIQKIKPNLNASEILGGIFAGLRVARVTETGPYVKNVNPAVAQGMGLGDSFEFMTAMAGALTQSAVDPTGRRTATAMTRLRVQMAEHLAPQLGADSTMEQQLNYLLSGKPEAEAIRQQMLGVFSKEASSVDQSGELTSEAKLFFPIVQLLTPGSAVNESFHQFMEIVPSLGRESKIVLDELEKSRAQLSLPKISEMSSKFRGTELGLQLTDVEAFKAEAGKGLENVLRASGAGDMATRIAVTKFNLAADAQGVDSVEDVTDRIEEQSRMLLRQGNPNDPFEQAGFFAAERSAGRGMNALAVSDADRRAGDALAELGRDLRELISIMRAREQKPQKVEVGPQVKRERVPNP